MKNLNRLFLLVLFFPVTLIFNACSSSTDYGDWIKTNAFSGVARSDAASFVIGNKGYVFGGYDGNTSHPNEGRLSDLWEFDTENGNDTWTQLADFPGTARNSASAFAIGTNGYIGLGFDGDNYLKDFWEYNSLTDTWSQKADFAGPGRIGAIAFAVAGKGYFGCGYDDNYLNDVYVYNPTTGLWSAAPTILGDKRDNGTAFVYNDEAYVVGGTNNGGAVTGFCKFNPTSNEWIELNAIYDYSDKSFDDNYANLARTYACVFIIGEYAYMTCGANASGTLLSDTWRYNFATDRWKKASAFEGSTREEAVTLSVNGRGFVLTGCKSTYRWDDVWEFLPDQEYDANRH
jgi:N-acetylneuraminic acid mutarotase